MPTAPGPIEPARDAAPGTMPDISDIDAVVSEAFRDHAAPVRGVAMRSTRDPELAADVTQEAFLRLLLELRAGRRPEFMRAWLHRTTANLIISRARRESVARRAAPRLLGFGGPSTPDAIAVLLEDREELQATLSTMSFEERSALVMAASGATGADIARRLGRTQGSTRTMLCRSRGRLRAARARLDATPAVHPDRPSERTRAHPALVTTGRAGRSAWQTRDLLPVVVATAHKPSLRGAAS